MSLVTEADLARARTRASLAVQFADRLQRFGIPTGRVV